MKILYIVTLADGGGAQKYTLTLAKKFSGSVAAGGLPQDYLFQTATLQGITSYRLTHLSRSLNPWKDVLAFLEIYRLIKSVNPDLVHSNSSKAGFLASLAAGLQQKKNLFTAHGMFFLERTSWLNKKFYIAAEKLASYFRDFIISVNERDRQAIISHKIISDNKTAAIPNGIEQIIFLAADTSRKALGISSGKIIFGCVAQLYFRKGFDILIEAVNLLGPELQKKIEVIIIGQGPEKTNLENLIATYGLKDCIKLIGYKNNAADYLRAFDVFLLCSRQEGWPYVILEAMQAGLPIISTEVGGTKEALADAGRLIPPDNAELLANAMQDLINSPELRQKLAEKALARSKEFTLEKMLQQTQTIYEQIVSTNNSKK